MEVQAKNTRLNWRILAVAGAGLMVLAGCEEGQDFSPFKAKPDPSATAPAATKTTKRARSGGVAQDVEAPELFSKKEQGLWDGRPSLGGIWVAHPDVKEPQRVIIRNTANSKSVVGALFRRERVNPGPPIQVSSEAATPLGMLAGAPAELSIVALKREEPEPEPPAPEVVPEPEQVEEVAAVEPEAKAVEAPVPAPVPAKPSKPAKSKTSGTSGEIEQTVLDPVANAAAALDDADGADASAAAALVAAAKPKKGLFALQKPFIQVGTFSVEENATNAASTLSGIGMVPDVKTQETDGATLWRVLVGPAASRAERRNMLKDIKGIGFDDAYFVTQ